VLDYLAFGHRISAITVLGAALVVVAIRGFSQVQTRLAGKPAT
jgi:drug/metabolite transporter (DMT)-like permease